MLYMSHLFSAASGKLSGLVASRNRGGPYVRAYVIPNDPETAEQIVCRDAMTNLAGHWRTDLTPGEKASWNSAASGLTFPNRLGQQRSITGRAYFFRQNFVREQASIVFPTITPYLRAAPPGPSQDIGPIPDVTLGGASDCEVEIAWPTAPPWIGMSETAMLIYASEITSNGINRYFGPWTLINFVPGDAWASPTNVQLKPGSTLGSGQRIFYRFIVTMNTGELSIPIEGYVENS